MPDPVTLALAKRYAQPPYQRGAVIWSGPGNSSTNRHRFMFAGATMLQAAGVPYDIINVSDVPSIDLSRYSVIALTATECDLSVLTAVRDAISAWTEAGGLLLTWSYVLTRSPEGVSQGTTWVSDLIGASSILWSADGDPFFTATANGVVELAAPDSPIWETSAYDFPTLDPARTELELATATGPTLSGGGLWVSTKGSGRVLATMANAPDWSRHDTNLVALYVKAIRHYLPGWLLPLPKAGMCIRVDADAGDSMLAASVAYLAAKAMRRVAWFITTDSTTTPIDVPKHWEIGSHSVTHPSNFDTLTEGQIETELLDSLAQLEADHGSIQAFALPGAGTGWYADTALLRQVNRDNRAYKVMAVNAGSSNDYTYQDGEITVVSTPLSDFSASNEAATFDAVTGAVYDNDMAKWVECFGSAGMLLTPSLHDYLIAEPTRQGWYDDRITALKALDTIPIGYAEYGAKSRSWQQNGVYIVREDARFVVNVHHYEPDLTVVLPDPGTRSVVVRDRDGVSLFCETSTDADGNLVATLR